MSTKGPDLSSSVLTEDMRDLVEVFLRHEVEFLVVGAHAVNAYTEARMTKDLDLWIHPTGDNARKTFAALKEFGAPLEKVTENDFCDEESFFVIGVKPNRVDVLMKIPGLEFLVAWNRRNIVVIDGLAVPILAYEDILQAKLTAGRPQDLLDAEKLRRVKREKK